MRISTRLLQATLAPAVMALVALGGVVVAYSPTLAAQEQQATFIEVGTELNALTDLARSYVVNHDERSRLQFLTLNEHTQEVLDRTTLKDAALARHADEIQANLETMRSLFERIVDSYNASGESMSPLQQEAEERLSAQMFIRASAATSGSAIIVRSLSDDIVRRQQQVSLLVALLTVAAAVLLTIALLGLRRGITRSLRALSTGTEVIGGGTLSYRIGMSEPDELGDLGRSFDAMAERLEGVTVSKAELEEEVEERRRVEDALRESLETTHTLLRAADTLSEPIAPQDVLETLVRVATEATGRSRALVSLYDAQRDTVTVVTTDGLTDAGGSSFALAALAPELRQALAERRPCVVDYESPEMAELSRRRAEAFGHRLVLIVPLVRGDTLIGYFSIDEPGERREFSERDIEIARGIASQASIAIENARLFEAQHTELKRTSVLQEVAAAAATLDLETLAGRVLDTLGESVGVRSSVLYLLDEQSAVLRMLALRGYAPDIAPLFAEVPLDDRSVSGQAVLHDEVMRFTFEDLPPATRARAEAAGEGRSSWAVLPVHVGGRAIGSFTLVFDEDRVLDTGDLELFRGVSDQIGVAIENARLHERTEEELARTRLLQDVAEAAASGLELEAVATRMLSAIERDLGMQAGDVRLLEDSHLRTLAVVGSLDSVARSHPSIRESEPGWLASRVAREGRLLTHEDESDFTAERRNVLAQADLLESRYLVMPLRYGSETLGVMSLAFKGRRQFRPEERDAFAAIARVVTQAIANGRLFEAERQAIHYSEALNVLDAEISATLDVDVIMKQVVFRTSVTVGADVGVILVLQDAQWEARYTWQGPEWLQGARVRYEELPHSAGPGQDRRAALYTDIQSRAGWEASLARRLQARDVLAATLALGGNEFAEFRLYKLDGQPFNDGDRDFVQKVTASASLALQNARRYARERHVADTLQEALLTMPTALPGLEFAHVYHSASDAARVGGDFYDLFELESGLVGITIGDISGKGLDAAVLTSLVKNAIRAQATSPHATPSAVMDVVNTVVLRSSAPEVFVTVFFAVLDTHTGRFVYCNAGHTASALVHPDGTTQALSANSPLAGAVADIAFTDEETVLGPEDVLFTYTDGLAEGRAPTGEFLGEERVFALLSEKTPKQSVQVVHDMLAEVIAYSGGVLTDDLAMLAVKRSPAVPERRRSEDQTR